MQSIKTGPGNREPGTEWKEGRGTKDDRSLHSLGRRTNHDPRPTISDSPLPIGLEKSSLATLFSFSITERKTNQGEGVGRLPIPYSFITNTIPWPNGPASNR